MKGATLFSGIGAPECAAPLIDWRWSADIDDFANAVRAHHWPDAPNLGDVAAIDGGSVDRPDVIVFGSPCQSFSVAGKRLGLADARGNLALVALALVARLRPRWFVFENVPGLISGAGGDDWAAFLDAVGECGYTGAWRILDAQYFGVPQRRRRVFFVGHLGDDWRPSAAVLFESESLSGHPPPRREAGARVAALTSAGVGTCGADDNQAQAGHLISFSCKDHGADAMIDLSPTLRAMGHGNSHPNAGGQPAIAVNLRGREGGAMPECDDVASIRAADGGSSRSYVAITGDVTHPLNSANNGKMSGEDGTGRGVPIVGFAQNQRGELRETEIATQLTVGGGKPGEGYPAVRVGPMVRRLTPVECERLQGFPDGWTDIPWRGKRAPDGRRYKALGNSMAVPVMRWILNRLVRQHGAAAGAPHKGTTPAGSPGGG